jgi:hypothetical protein
MNTDGKLGHSWVHVWLQEKTREQAPSRKSGGNRAQSKSASLLSQGRAEGTDAEIRSFLVLVFEALAPGIFDVLVRRWYCFAHVMMKMPHALVISQGLAAALL